MENVFPKIEPDDMIELLSNMESRIKWDERWSNAKIISRDGNSTVLYFCTPMSPDPQFRQRDFVIQFYLIKNWQIGIHLLICQGVEHPDYPEKTGMLGYIRGKVEMQAVIVEQNPYGSGSMVTEIRSLNMEGSIS